ncbi:hypothetical protein ZYGR_0N03070 [Zygosaccharomyces rouxii]|uniref:Uncharacterized protein n=1 Tax=Zygosaccharomyces rouxii TaxID=4956 RepID=A0A1Q2ZZQ1_ZYGRO|nr:hypothetical protein ZYGR_0N03070 [Zygosaccharomyces rouxii]
MNVIDLSSQQVKDESCEYIDLNQAETEVFESSPLKEVVQNTVDEEQVPDYEPQINSQNIPAIETTRDKLGNLQLEQHVEEYSAVNRREEIPESMEQRLLRIKNELEEIKALQELGHDSVNSQDLKMLEDLHHQLNSDSQSKMQGLRQRLSKETEADAVVLPHFTMNFEDCKRLLEVDQRMSLLEGKVGSTLDQEDDKSLVTKLEVLFRQIKILKNDSDTLGQFHERLAQINKNYEDSLAGRKARTDAKLYDAICGGMTMQETKVEELYKYHGLLESYGPIFPQLLNRIKQLSGMSDKILESYEIAHSLNSSVMDLQSQANKWENILNSVEQKLDQQEIDLNKNASYVNKRIAALENKPKS